MVRGIKSFVLFSFSSGLLLTPGFYLPAIAGESSAKSSTQTLQTSAPTIRSLLPDESLLEYCRDVRINAIVIPAFCTLIVQARQRYQQGNYQGTIELYDQALSLNPKYSKGYYNRAMAFLAVGDLAAAKADLQKAAQLFNTQKDAINQQKALTALADLGS